MTFLNICAHEDCANVLGPTNYSGVCRLHNHSAACRCAACSGDRAKPVRHAPGQRVARVRRQDGMGPASVAEVSLVAEPWAVQAFSNDGAAND